MYLHRPTVCSNCILNCSLSKEQPNKTELNSERGKNEKNTQLLSILARKCKQKYRLSV